MIAGVYGLFDSVWIRSTNIKALRWLACWVLIACRGPAQPETPEQAVRALIDRLQRVHGDGARSREAYEMLSKASQENLVERAQRASDTLGRPVQPEEMLAPSRFFLEFEPEHWSTVIRGPWAVVTAQGPARRQQREVRCVLEEGLWKVVMDFPPLSPVETRGN